MRRGTQAIIGATLLILGASILFWGALEEETQVRQVEEVHQEPLTHTSGTYTLMGVPQPSHITGAGETSAAPNSAFTNATTTITWQRNGTTFVSHHTVTVTPQDGGSKWHLVNETRTPGQAGAVDIQTDEWFRGGPHHVFLIENFHTQSNSRVALWGIYEGTFRDPLQPKPSQFEGRITMENGTPVYVVEDYTAGCSSKFLPPEYQEEEDES